LQGSVLKVWLGNPENAKAAQERLLMLAKNNSLATQGLFENENNEKNESLYVKN